ncbi:L-serine ammonia-lyase, iron-sulfur-dependent, subunit beta, partial [Staphylococcus agnetis]|nr:L-serine ammonia-lyase, iron-sulfur-dependent, subunit beta [Staphylococcus agnetis]
LMTCELDEDISEAILNEIRQVPGVVTVSLMGDA